jgi:hypothetical protein
VYVVRLCHLLLPGADGTGQLVYCAVIQSEREIWILWISRRVARPLAALGVTPTLLNLSAGF